MATIYAFLLSNGSYKVGETSKDDPYERLEKTFSTGSTLYRYFPVDPERRKTIENLIHKELAPFRDYRADGREVFIADAKDTIDRLFDLWGDGDVQLDVISKAEKAQIEALKALPADQLTDPIPMDEELEGWVALWRHHKEIAAKHGKYAEVWQQKIQTRMGTAAGIQGEINWSSHRKDHFDKPGLKKAYPELVAQFTSDRWERRMVNATGRDRT